MSYYYNQDFLEAYIGRGLTAISTFDYTTLKADSVSGVPKLNDSIFTILSTRIGERLMMPEFGSRLHNLIFEPNNPIFEDLADFYIREALRRWEKRIEVTNVSVKIEVEGNVVPIQITYRITNSNIVETYVYPFSQRSNGDPDFYEQGTIDAGKIETAPDFINV